MKEEVELAGERALLPESTLGHHLDFAVKIREPGYDQTGVRIPDAPEQNTIQQFGHLENSGVAAKGETPKKFVAASKTAPRVVEDRDMLGPHFLGGMENA
jgi:hypothetical protein